MTIVFCFILLPISEHSYVVKAMKKLYIARTRDKDLFLPPKEKKPRKSKAKLRSCKSVEEHQCKAELKKIDTETLTPL
jgi:hypothetical protein